MSTVLIIVNLGTIFKTKVKPPVLFVNNDDDLAEIFVVTICAENDFLKNISFRQIFRTTIGHIDHCETYMYSDISDILETFIVRFCYTA